MKDKGQRQPNLPHRHGQASPGLAQANQRKNKRKKLARTDHGKGEREKTQHAKSQMHPCTNESGMTTFN